MRKGLLIILISLCGYLRSQNPITFSDIVYAKNHSLSMSEEYFSKKGYDYVGKTEFIGNNWYYVFGYGGVKNGVQIKIGVEESSKKIIQIDVMIENRNTYLNIREKIKSLGYVLSKEDPIHFDTMYAKYTKGNSEVHFSSGENSIVGKYYSIIYW